MWRRVRFGWQVTYQHGRGDQVGAVHPSQGFGTRSVETSEQSLCGPLPGPFGRPWLFPRGDSAVQRNADARERSRAARRSAASSDGGWPSRVSAPDRSSLIPSLVRPSFELGEIETMVGLRPRRISRVKVLLGFRRGRAIVPRQRDPERSRRRRTASHTGERPGSSSESATGRFVTEGPSGCRRPLRHSRIRSPRSTAKRPEGCAHRLR